MRTILILIACCISLQSTITGKAQNSQQRIGQALGIAFREQNPSAMEQVEKELTSDYWRSYCDYYKAIYLLKSGEKEKSRQSIENGIKRLEKLKEKTSESYALVSVLRTFSMQFVKNAMKQGMIPEQVKDEAQKAITLDGQNVRAYYALASIDFYTPQEYGGGTNAEKLLLKAVTLEEQYGNAADLPTWGKDSSYQMLISLYLKNKDKVNARKYWEEAIKQYPEDRMIESLREKF